MISSSAFKGFCQSAQINLLNWAMLQIGHEVSMIDLKHLICCLQATFPKREGAQTTENNEIDVQMGDWQ